MKKIIFILTLCILFVACATQKLTPEQKAERAENITKMLKDRHYYANMKVMHTSYSGSQQIDYSYGVTVKGDTIISNLPYVGKSHNLSYSSDEGLNFQGVITEYRLSREKQDATKVQILAATANELYLYNMDVYDDGNIQLIVTARQKEALSFGGEIEPLK